MLGPYDLNNPPSGSEHNYSNIKVTKRPSALSARDITPRSFGSKKRSYPMSTKSENEGKVEKFLKISDFVTYIIDKMDIFLETKLEGV